MLLAQAVTLSEANGPGTRKPSGFAALSMTRVALTPNWYEMSDPALLVRVADAIDRALLA